MWFDYNREEGFPTMYPPNATPVTVDVLDAGFLCAFVVLLVSFIIAVPTARLKENVSFYVRVIASLIIGLCLLLGNFGQEWEVGHIVSKTAYRAGTNKEIHAEIGVRIGLRSINVTLKRAPNANISNELPGEIIDYNERFEWDWDQGRFGFGPYAGKLQQQFRAAQYRGVPFPILWIIDYFVIDGEGFRFGRFYRTAGWYAHIASWTAFPCWMISLIMFRSVVSNGAYFLGITGLLQLFANLLWTVIRNAHELEIPFEDETLITKFGPSYWLTFGNGVVCLALAIAIWVMDRYYNKATYVFFGVDPLNNYDTAYLTPEEMECLRVKPAHSDIPMNDMNPRISTLNVYSPDQSRAILMRRGTMRNPQRMPKPKHYRHDDEQPIYGNQETIQRFEEA